MEILLVIFYLILAILSLILFFKIWWMTNDVAALKKQLVPEGETTLTELVATGETDKAAYNAKHMLYAMLSETYFSSDITYKNKSAVMEEKLSTILPRIQRLGLDLPDNLTSAKAFIEFMNGVTGKSIPC